MNDWLFATPSDIKALLDEGYSWKAMAKHYGVEYSVVAKEARRLFREGIIAPGKEQIVANPVSIMDLGSFQCAIVVDGDFPLPHYCGAPVTNLRFRLCEEHEKGFFARDNL